MGVIRSMYAYSSNVARLPVADAHMHEGSGKTPSYSQLTWLSNEYDVCFLSF